MRQHSTNKTENVFGLPAAPATKKCELSNGSLTTPELCAFLCSSSCTLFVSSCYSKLSKFALKPVAFITLHFLILLISEIVQFHYGIKVCILNISSYDITHIQLTVLNIPFYCLSFCLLKSPNCVLQCLSSCFCIEHILLLVDPFAGVEIYLYLLHRAVNDNDQPPHLTLLWDVHQMRITLMLRQMRPLYNLF